MSEDLELRQRMIRLAEQLLQRTREGGLQWGTTDDESVYMFSGTNTSALIASKTTPKGNKIMLGVLNSRGAFVEGLSSEWDLETPEDPWSSGPAPWNELLEDLYIMARRSPLDVDKVLDDLFADLQKEGSSPGSGPGAEPSSDEPPF